MHLIARVSESITVRFEIIDRAFSPMLVEGTPHAVVRSSRAGVPRKACLGYTGRQAPEAIQAAEPDRQLQERILVSEEKTGKLNAWVDVQKDI